MASRFGYPNYRLSELSLVPVSSDNRRFAVFITVFYIILVFRWNAVSLHHSTVLLGPIKVAGSIVIKEFLDNPFSLHQLHNKLRIMNKGRPTSPLPNVITHYKTKNDVQGVFATLSNEKVDWLAGGETANQLYFLSCLFFL